MPRAKQHKEAQAARSQHRVWAAMRTVVRARLRKQAAPELRLQHELPQLLRAKIMELGACTCRCCWTGVPC